MTSVELAAANCVDLVGVDGKKVIVSNCDVISVLNVAVPG
jgi:hypothetical protein